MVTTKIKINRLENREYITERILMLKKEMTVLKTQLSDCERQLKEYQAELGEPYARRYTQNSRQMRINFIDIKLKGGIFENEH